MSENIFLWIGLAVATYLLYAWIDRKRWAGRIKINGRVLLNGGQSLEVESEPQQQKALVRASNRKGADADGLVATLVAVPTNEDTPAIVVKIGGDTVGRLSPSAEKQYLPVVRRLLAHHKLGECRATIGHAAISGNGPDAADGAEGELPLVLRLDLARPDKAIPRGTFGAETAAG